MGKYISGYPTKANLEKWQNYSAQNGQETARKSEGPTRQNVSSPDQIRYHVPGGRNGGVDADAGLVRKSGGHSFPSISAGGGSGEGRMRLSNAQARKR